MTTVQGGKICGIGTFLNKPDQENCLIVDIFSTTAQDSASSHQAGHEKHSFSKIHLHVQLEDILKQRLSIICYLHHLGQRNNSEKEHYGSPIGKHCHSWLAPTKGVLGSTLNWTPGIPDYALHINQISFDVSLSSSKIDILSEFFTWWHAIPQKRARIYQRLVYTRSSGKSSVFSTPPVSCFEQ